MEGLLPSLFNRLGLRPRGFSNSILVSFCNMTTPMPGRTGLLWLNLRNERARWIKINGDGEPRTTTCTGLSGHNREIYTAFAIGPSFHLAVLDMSTLRLKAVHQLDEVEDVHSICASDSGVYVVSTGTDEVTFFPFEDGKPGRREVIWSPSHQGCDTHHVNSVWVQENGDVICSGFGLRKSEKWTSAENGYIYNINTQTAIEQPIVHPHSVTVALDKIYYCESSFSGLNTLNKERLFELHGYTRGVCFLDDTTVVVGSSKGRKVSKSTGLTNDNAEVITGVSAVYVCDLKTGRVLKHIDLSQYGEEIYDLYYPAGGLV